MVSKGFLSDIQRSIVGLGRVPGEMAESRCFMRRRTPPSQPTDIVHGCDATSQK